MESLLSTLRNFKNLSLCRPTRMVRYDCFAITHHVYNAAHILSSTQCVSKGASYYAYAIINIILVFSSFTRAQADGILDTGFMMRQHIASIVDGDIEIKAIAIQKDGKVVGVGYTRRGSDTVFAMTRYTSDGSIDTSFGDKGRVLQRFGLNDTKSGAHAVVIQHDGKIVVGGFTNAVKNTFRWCLARYFEDGALDTSFFGGQGIVPGTVITHFGNGETASQLNGLVLQPDGKIVAAGFVGTHESARMAVARYLPDGCLDAKHFNPKSTTSKPGTLCWSCNPQGPCDDQAYAVALDSNNKIIIAGSSCASGVRTFALTRFTSAGEFDHSFFTGGLSKVPGTVITSFGYGETEGQAHALVVQADGKIVAAGYTNSNACDTTGTRFALMRCDAQGKLDASFGGSEFACIPGTVITSFDPTEKRASAQALVLQPDGKLIAAGTTAIRGKSLLALARYNANGTIDTAFHDQQELPGRVLTALADDKIHALNALALAADGSIIIAGTNTVRYHTSYNALEGPVITAPSAGAVIVDGSAIVLHGTAQNPGTVHISLDGVYQGSAVTRGPTNRWKYPLPALKSGFYHIDVEQSYAGGKIMLANSEGITIRVDQNPTCMNLTQKTCGLMPVSGTLRAGGATGNYLFSLVSAENGTATVVGDTYTFIPTISSGIGKIIFQAKDAATGGMSIGTVTITVHAKPEVAPLRATTRQEHSVRGDLKQALGALAQPVTFAAYGAPSNGQVTVDPDGSFIFEPKKGFLGTAQFQYYSTDSNGYTSDLATATINVTSLPHADDGTLYVYQGCLLHDNLQRFASDGKYPYTFAQVDDCQDGTVCIASDGSCLFCPCTAARPSSAFTYRVTDAELYESNIGTVGVAVIANPWVASAAYAIPENTVLQVSLAEFAHAGKPPYAFVLVGNPAEASCTLSEDGSLSFTPAKGGTGIFDVAYKIVDAHRVSSNTGTITIQVNPVPVLIDCSFSFRQDTVLQANLMPYVNNGAMPYHFSVLQAQHGTVHLHDEGTFEFIPEPGFYGKAQFTYQVTDSNAGTSMASVVTLLVGQAPHVKDSAFTTYAGVPVQGDLQALVHDGIKPYSFYATGALCPGSMQVHPDGTFVYEPLSTGSGNMLCQYQVDDSNTYASNMGTLNITVLSRPVGAPGALGTQENTPLHANLLPLVSGGVPAYTFTITKHPEQGKLICMSDGSFVFIPEPNLTGTVTFEYTVSDINHVTSAPASVSIIVAKPPTVAGVLFSGNENRELCKGLDSFVSGGMRPYHFKLEEGPWTGTLTLDPSGVFTFTPDEDFFGRVSFKYSVIDAYNCMSNTAGATIDIAQALRAESGRFTMQKNKQLHGTLQPLVVGGVAPHRYRVISCPKGKVTLNPDGTFIYRALFDFSGDDHFTYCVQDIHGVVSNTAEVIITVGKK